MKTKRLFKVLSFICILFLTSCSPKVVTKIIKTLPETDPGMVLVTDDLESLSNYPVTELGRIFVGDGGATPSNKCTYEKVEALAKAEIAKAGGNVLYIDNHTFPSFFTTTCHQISGVMLYSPEYADNYSKKEYAQYDAVVAESKTYQKSTHMFYLSAGPTGITSEVYDLDGGKVSTGIGVEFTAGYEWVGKKRCGLGMRYSRFSRDFDLSGSAINWTLSEFTPEFVCKVNFSRNWYYRCNIGIGLGMLEESMGGMSQTFMGVNCSGVMGVDYMLNKHFAIGLSATVSTVYINQPAYDKKEANGVSRISLSGGIRYYL